METNEQDNSLFGLTIDTTTRGHLAEAARWANFLAIMGFIICGLIVLGGIFAGSILASVSGYGGGLAGNTYGSGLGALMAVVYILFALLYFFPCLFLFRFSRKMKSALASNDQPTLNGSFQNLKAMFRFVGILTIIVLCFYGLALIVGLITAASSGF